MTYTPMQFKQLAFADKLEPTESLAYPRTYNVSCRTCHEHKTFHAADSIRSFIGRHEAHNTWLTVLRAQDGLTLNNCRSPRQVSA